MIAVRWVERTLAKAIANAEDLITDDAAKPLGSSSKASLAATLEAVTTPSWLMMSAPSGKACRKSATMFSIQLYSNFIGLVYHVPITKQCFKHSIVTTLS